MYGQLPDYDDFQRYDLGAEGVLCQISHKIYASYRKPSWPTLKHHLFMAKITKGIPKELKDAPESDKKDDFQT